MAIPKYRDFVEPILRYLARIEGSAPSREVSDAAADVLGVTVRDRKERVSTGKPVYLDRASWGFNWLKRAGLAEAATPGEWQLTTTGREIAAAHVVIPARLWERLDAEVRRRTNSSAGHPMPPPSGDRKAYRLPSQPLATEGQADVYRAIRKADNQVVAFKRVRGQSKVERMRREINVQCALQHPNIMPIIDWDLDYRWYVMPMGVRVMAQIERPFELELLCLIAKSVLAGLKAGHEAGHPHRDVKPQNVIELVDAEGVSRWVLADWGLTRRALGETTTPLTQTGQFLGSAGFAPPEAYTQAHRIGLPGDLYSLGQLISWATGVDPIPNVSPKVEEPWRRAAEALTQQAAEQRPQSIGEVEGLLSEVCDGAASVKLLGRR